MPLCHSILVFLDVMLTRWIIGHGADTRDDGTQGHFLVFLINE